MTYAEASKKLTPDKYRHFKGFEYKVISIARHSETTEPMSFTVHYTETRTYGFVPQICGLKI